MSIELQEKLDKALENCRKKPDMASLNDLTAIASEVLHLVINVDDHALKEVALRKLPDILHANAAIQKGLYRSMSGLIVDFLCKSNNVEYVMALPNGEREIAWICCERSRCYYPSQTKTSPSDPLVHILNKATGKIFPEDKTPTLDNVVSLLYGEYCWALYSDTDGVNKKHSELSQISIDIRNSGISIIASKTEKNVCIDNQNFPVDILP